MLLVTDPPQLPPPPKKKSLFLRSTAETHDFKAPSLLVPAA